MFNSRQTPRQSPKTPHLGPFQQFQRLFIRLARSRHHLAKYRCALLAFKDQLRLVARQIFQLARGEWRVGVRVDFFGLQPVRGCGGGGGGFGFGFGVAGVGVARVVTGGGVFGPLFDFLRNRCG